MPVNDDAAALEQQVMTVSHFLEITNKCMQSLGTAVVRGEISECNLHNHLYFKLKDESSCVDCLMWGTMVRRLQFTPQIGMQVVVTGHSSVYKKRGTFRLLAEQMLPAGRGLIMERLEQLRRQLQQEGVFDRLSRAVPRFVDRVGIITSPEGRVLHDIKTTLLRRNPLIDTVLYPAAVQGEGAAQSLCQALRQAYAERSCDVLILGRGGGSFEDLLPFSDEALTRLTAQSPIPIISAVGHEPDTVLTDYAADVRAATPTAAAELVSSFTRQDLQRACVDFSNALDHCMGLILDEKKQQLAELCRALTAAGPGAQIMLQRSRLDNILQALTAAQRRRQDLAGWSLGQLEQRLLAASPRQRLQLASSRLDACRQALSAAVSLQLSRGEQRYVQLQQRLAAAAPQQQLRLQAADLNNRLQLLHHAAERRLQQAEAQLHALQQRLQVAGPEGKLQQLSSALPGMQQALTGAVQQQLAGARALLPALERRLTACDPGERLQQQEGYLSGMAARARQAVQKRLLQADTRLQTAAGRLTGLNPLAVLQRGYSVTRDASGQILQLSHASPGSTIATRLAGGTVYSVITAVQPDGEADSAGISPQAGSQ